MPTIATWRETLESGSGSGGGGGGASPCEELEEGLSVINNCFSNDTAIDKGSLDHPARFQMSSQLTSFELMSCCCAIGHFYHRQSSTEPRAALALLLLLLPIRPRRRIERLPDSCTQFTLVPTSPHNHDTTYCTNHTS